jgi:hypothetical protein
MSGQAPKLICIALLLAAPTTAAQTIYRCEGEDGQTIFSERPCSPDAETVEVGPTNSSEPMSDAMRQELRKQERRSRLQSLEAQERRIRAEGERRSCEIARNGVAEIERIWQSHKVGGYTPDDQRYYQESKRNAESQVRRYCK